MAAAPKQAVVAAKVVKAPEPQKNILEHPAVKAEIAKQVEQAKKDINKSMIEHIDMTIKSKIEDKLTHAPKAAPAGPAKAAPGLAAAVMGKRDVALDYHNKVIERLRQKKLVFSQYVGSLFDFGMRPS